MTRTVSHPRIHLDHPRAPQPSRASMWLVIDWLKDGPLAECPMTEAELYDLAEEALKAARLLRKQREGAA